MAPSLVPEGFFSDGCLRRVSTSVNESVFGSLCHPLGVSRFSVGFDPEIPSWTKNLWKCLMDEMYRLTEETDTDLPINPVMYSLRRLTVIVSAESISLLFRYEIYPERSLL